MARVKKQMPLVRLSSWLQARKWRRVLLLEKSTGNEEARLPDVVPKLCSQRPFIQDVLHVHLDKRKRPLFLPGPMSRIEGFPPQDVADRVRGENQAFLLPEVSGKPFPSITCAFSRFPDLSFDFPCFWFMA